MQAGALMPNSSFEGEYEDPSVQEYCEEAISVADNEALPSQKCNLRVVSPLSFEPAEALSPEQSDAYLARFSVLLLDEQSGRHGGIGTVYYASNPFGERLAVKVPNRSKMLPRFLMLNKSCFLRRRNCCSVKSLNVTRNSPALKASPNFLATAIFRTNLH